MANNNPTSHTLDIIRAALPYVGRQTKHTMEIALKAGELAESFQSKPDTQLHACDMEEQAMDIEGLLTSIQSICTGQEQEMINSILNFYKTRNLYRAYQDFKKKNTNTQQPHLEAADINHDNNGFNNMFQNSTLLQFLMSQFTPEQKATFEGMNMLLNNGFPTSTLKSKKDQSA